MTDTNCPEGGRCPECDREFQTGPIPPPDPDGQNDRRAAWAEYALVAFRSQTECDREDALTDLLANLMHWNDRAGNDFDAALRRARAHYEAETLGASA